MNNYELIFDYGEYASKRIVYIKFESVPVDFYNLYGALKKIGKNTCVVNFQFQDSFFIDALVLLYFEVCIYKLLKDNKNLFFTFKFSKKNNVPEISRKMLYQSHLYECLYNTNNQNTRFSQNRKGLNSKKYINTFKENKDTTEMFTHFRFFVSRQNLKNELEMNNILSDIREKISCTLTSNNNKISTSQEIEIKALMTEFIGNVKDHTIDGEGIILYHIDDAINSKTNINVVFLNIAFLNLSENLIYNDMNKLINEIKINIEKNNLSNIRKEKIKIKYKNLVNHYELQSKYFNEEYTNEHFLIYSAFQENITTRPVSYGINGGTGLFEIVKAIGEDVDIEGYNCYVYAGQKACFFRPSILKHIDGQYAFNTNGNVSEPIEDIRTGKCFLNGIGFSWQIPLIINKGEL